MASLTARDDAPPASTPSEMDPVSLATRAALAAASVAATPCATFAL
ncbi:hypothetical protein JFPO14_contig00039-0036 [Edwardsiella piscicida]|nr:hypothetical protein JFPO13_contig000040-0001 [Edwardsiella piscicida]GBK59942.1 hypothetical protein JFPO14_contig00039-0036 [Edwardsiella piscicida]